MDFTRRGFLGLAGGAAVSLGGGFAPEVAQAAATSPFKLVSRFAVEQGLAGGSRKLIAAPRAAGGFLAFWEQSPDANRTLSFVRPYDAKANVLGRNLQISSDTLGQETVGSVITHPDGTANVFSFGKVAPDSSGSLFWMHRLGPTGARIGPRVRIGTGTSGRYHQAARLADGRMVTAWFDGDRFANLAKLVSPTGTVLAETQETLFHNWVVGATNLPKSAGVVLASYWGPAEVAFHILDANLQKVGDPIIFPALMGYQGVTLAPHPAGFVAMWAGAAQNGVDNPFIDGAVISPDGQVLVRLRPVRLTAGLDQNNGHPLFPAVLTLPDGRILFARNRRALDGKGRDLFQIVLHLYGKDGKVAAPRALAYQDRSELNEFFVHINYPRSLIRLRNGTILLTYDTGPWGGPHVAQAMNFKVL